ncbi:MAG: FAD-dependent oxidoreductase, partial [Bacteroidota bacterium]|nr:FAD-dependent oxidoreductase [Bacteroidota bacterium]
AEYINILKRHYVSLQKIDPVIQLVNSCPTILNVLQPKFQRIIRYTEKVMKQYNIEVINNNKISKVTDEGAFLNDGYLQSSMVISTIGQSRMVLKGTENMQRDNLKRIYTNAYLQINNSNIWGGGDICHVAHYKTGKACPSNALWAIKHGEYVGRNIALFIKSQPLKPFDYGGLGQCASLGIGKGIGELYGLQFTGWLAWIMRWFFFNYFMPSRTVMFNAISDWMFLLFRRKRKGLYIEKNKINFRYLQTTESLH